MLQSARFFSKTKVFKHFWKPFPFPVATFHNFLLKRARFFHKLRFLSISGPYFRFLWQNSATFCQNTEVKPWKIWFSKENQLPFPFFSIFAILRPHFHQLFAKILRWSLENFKFKKPETEIGLLPVNFWHFRLINQLPLPTGPFTKAYKLFLEEIYKHYRWRRCHIRWKTADIRFRCRHLPRIYPRDQSIFEEIQELQPFTSIIGGVGVTL